ncbi:putative large subunit GTPase 1 [Xylona heveae TC161]|uniref:Putative large subunit GTPase 1 n=1 Tax=Xylona heveae (strain CBS 132557 / TC161) TaxID=1328760 RepID=A0A164ZJG9_XYLHT|nr:putative large subunit GTPase 1 [Xylona heveae TC161]KZF19177.1 putative large subunit GTPase 1 [Xylona heveae TC161]
MNDRFGKGKGADRRRGAPGIQRVGPDGEAYVTHEKEDAAWVKMRSVTEQGALDEFLSTAELAGTDFTAEKMNNVKIIHTDQKNPYLLSAKEENAAVKKQNANRGRLTVPRRPPWDHTTTPQELDRRERDSLLQWRRGLAELQEANDLLMTPFERNLEVWRQLWRVIERSDLIVQIVDARNPLLFRCDDLEKYVKEVDPRKNNLLLVNKADMMTVEQRTLWADYFERAGINYKFFSASLAKERNEAQESESDEESIAEELEQVQQSAGGEDKLAEETKKLDLQDAQDENAQWTTEETLDGPSSSGAKDQRVAILTVDELEALFLENAPEIEQQNPDAPRKTVIGLVGYPNVGKSSTINALIGAKKVSVSATPGKTKHFQTIHLSPSVILCDCPGLVFPNFATTKAELVCSGVLPIDQLREFTGPAGLVAQRIPQAFIEAIYGVKIPTRPLEEGGTGIPTAQEVLSAYARARGFATTGHGEPDESRAARYVLKDYVNGKLLFCHPPPHDPAIDPRDFNRDMYDESHLPEKRRAALAAHANQTDPSLMDHPEIVPMAPVQGEKSSRLDKGFFGPGSGAAGHYHRKPFSYKYSEQGQAEHSSGKPLSGRKQRTLKALELGVDPQELRSMGMAGGKKHFKGNKKAAMRAKTGDY